MAIHTISLFTGYSGLDLSIRIACRSARTVCYVENDAKAAELLVSKAQSGCVDDAPIYGDIRSFDGKRFSGFVDGIVGGFPCTNLSVAGDRDGLIEGNASGLWHQFARIIGEVRPRWVYVENVAGILVPHGHDTDERRVLPAGLWFVLGALSRLGYDTEWLTLRASDVGAAQERRRTFILGVSRCAKWRAHTQPGGCGELRNDILRQAAGWARDADQILVDSRRQRDERRRNSLLLGCEEDSQQREALKRQRHGSADLNSGSAMEFTEERGLGELWQSSECAGLLDRTSSELEHASNPRCSEGYSLASKPIRHRARRSKSDRRSGEMGKPASAGFKGRASESVDVGEEFAAAERTSFDVFPPGQGTWSDWYTAPDGRAIRFAQDRDAERWCELLRDSPWLIPAVEPGIRCVAYGSSLVVDQHRTDQLRMLGNGVVPMQGAGAFIELVRRMGIVDWFF